MEQMDVRCFGSNECDTLKESVFDCYVANHCQTDEEIIAMLNDQELFDKFDEWQYLKHLQSFGVMFVINRNELVVYN